MLTKQINGILKKHGVLNKDAAGQLAQYDSANNGNILDFCADYNLIPAAELMSLLQTEYSLPIVDLDAQQVDDMTAQLLPRSVCYQYTLIPFKMDPTGIYVATAQQETDELRAYIEQSIGRKVYFYLARTKAVQRELDRVFASSPEENKRYIQELIDKARMMANEPSAANDEGPIISLLNNLITYGLKNGASDMHLEPREEDAIVRLRIDGLLHEAFAISKEMLIPLIARIKILSNLRTDEHQRPQDGRFSFSQNSYKIAIRVSIVPMLFGSKASLRFLDTNNNQVSVDVLGLEPTDRERLLSALNTTSGLILVSGPTGSGKTTTLYALVKQLMKKDINISTIEDPVEYHLHGANQLQVNPHVDLTFASGLRALLRQDPDIILVGEIRDRETAAIAMNAALTGHLVLASLHTNSAASAIPRLLDMGIDPYLVTSTLRAVLAQRLVRTVCRHCKRVTEGAALPDIFSGEQGKGQPKKMDIVHAVGCDHCFHTGYQGRSGIFELLTVDEKIQSLILERATAQTIENEARAKGMTTIRTDGYHKVQNHMTTPEEVVRVIQ